MLLMTQTNVHKISWLYVALVSGFIFHSVDTSNFVVTRVSSGKQFRLQRRADLEVKVGVLEQVKFCITFFFLSFLSVNV